jgi:hypothetical protein
MSTEIIRASEVNLDDLQRMAKMMVTSGYFDAAKDMSQGVAQMAIKIMAGREMGYGPFASVQGIHVIQGKPSIAANLMAAAVKAHPRYDYRVRKMGNDAVAIEFFENGQSLGISEFTADDAKKANTQNMSKFARNMLFARALSNGVRWYCPDVFNGNAVYVPEELGADVDGEGNVIDLPTRKVDTTTGEIVEQPQHRQNTTAPADDLPSSLDELPELAPAIDNPFNDKPAAKNGNGGKAEQARPGAITKPQKNTLHALGEALYGDKAAWDIQRPVGVRWASNKRTEHSGELWQAEGDKLIARLEEKVRTEYTEFVQLLAGSGDTDPLADVANMNGVTLANAMKDLRKRVEAAQVTA